MPLRLPKGLRRKSAGNVLDEAEPPAEPSFRVLERPRSAALRGPGHARHDSDPDPDNIFAGLDKANRYAAAATSSPPIPPPTTAAMTTTLPDSRPPSPSQRPRPPSAASVAWTMLTRRRGSSGTAHTASTGRFDDSSASSVKHSSSSTLPSSAGASAHDVPPIPEAPFSFSLRAAGRTFSFGSKSPKVPPPPPPAASSSSTSSSSARPPTHPPPSSSGVRGRATTASTASTATPPRLESNFDLGGDADWGNLFDGLDREKKAAPSTGAPAPQNQPASTTEHKRMTLPSLLAPLRLDRKKSDPSPTSSDSQSSGDALMGPAAGEPAPTRTLVPPPDPRNDTPNVEHTDPNRNPNHADSPHSPDPMSPATLRSPADETATTTTSAAPQRLRSPPGLRAVQDPDASSPYGSDSDFTPIPLNRPSADEQQPRIARKPVPRPAVEPEPSSLPADAGLAARYEEMARHSANKPSKVMTASQFERYRLEQELRRQNSRASSESSRSDRYDDDEDDEDEAEKRRKAANLRKKQEAHLAVYRQQMMKLTGEKHRASGPDHSRPLSLDREGLGTVDAPANGETTATTSSIADHTTTNNNSSLNPRSSTYLSVPTAATRQSGSSQSKSSDGSDDEDIPLGILAAHGFPSKNRPPTRLAAHSSNPNLRASFQPSLARPASGMGHRTSTLPVFARNLPADPYYGAGLVNQPNRQSLGLRSSTPVPDTVPPGLPPGGLIEVIANEERARMMRRGSPNAPLNMRESMVGGPGTLLGQQQMRMSQVPAFDFPPPQQQFPMSNDGQTQAQMTQFMQMQMQFMQQMMQNMQMGMNANPNNNNFLSPNNMMPNQPRPVSMVSNRSFAPNGGTPGTPRQYDQRTLSMLDPSMSRRFNHHQNNNRQSFIPPLSDLDQGLFGSTDPGYAASIAPSERSNVGRSARYRPVSAAAQSPNAPPAAQRSSTFTSSTLQPPSADGLRRNSISASTSLAPGAAAHSPTARPASLLRPPSAMPVASSGLRNSVPGPDDDDEDGWEEMLEAREKKKNGWKFKKGVSGLSDLFIGAHDKI